jgi:hypothetical protein
MVSPADVALHTGVAVADELIGKKSNPIGLENFANQGREHHIFIHHTDVSSKYNDLYRYLNKKKIIYKDWRYLITLNFKFLVKDKKLLTEESLKETLKDFSDKDNINYDRLSHFLTNYKYQSKDQIAVIKNVTKNGGKKTRKNIHKKNKTISYRPPFDGRFLVDNTPLPYYNSPYAFKKKGKNKRKTVRYTK